MPSLINLRRWVYGLRRKYFQPRANPPVYDPGLPLGIEPGELDEICREHFNEHAREFSYQHLSGWKSAGAYRVRINTARGNIVSLIYKDSLYAPELIPALVDLPVIPGPPEYVIFSQPDGALAPYLPRVYLAEEIEPKAHYRYVLEDLKENYSIVYGLEDILRLTSLLPKFHQALDEWSTNVHPQGLLNYGKEFSLAMQEYARINLVNYSQQSDDSTLKAVLERWPQIAEMHLKPDFFALQPSRPIHGDTNYTNIHIHKHDPQQFKIVDWEWAGFGSPYADLASLLKSAPKDIEKLGFNRFTGTRKEPNPCLNHDLTEEESHRLYLWCQLERGMLDAGFLAAQCLKSNNHTAFSLPRAVTVSLQRLLTVYQQLSN